jgi:hypothetical protein
VQALFSVTLFISAGLIFWIQLLVARLLLPVLGGSAAVWNTAMVFFQAGLLGGYLYAHVSGRWIPPRLQPLLHIALLGLAGLVLPVALKSGQVPPVATDPVYWMLGTLALMVGAPYVILSGTAPMLQGWFARSRSRLAADPYFLYAASNLGSFAALLSYPTAIERFLPLAAQSRLWTILYAAAAVLTAACALAARPGPAGAYTPAPILDGVPDAGPNGVPAESNPWVQRLRWLVLAFVPSSLLLGVTNYLTTDVAAAPLFWVVPLALYLLTFVLAFARKSWMPLPVTARIQPFLVVPVVVLMAQDFHGVPEMLFPLHLFAFFVTALMCHQQLALLRPPAGRLTEYYLLLSLGGALGGVFNALVAPVIFSTVFEYPIMLVAACLLRPGLFPSRGEPAAALKDLAFPGGLFAFLAFAPASLHRLDIPPVTAYGGLAIVVAGVAVAILFRKRPLRFAVGLVAIFAAAVFAPSRETQIYRVRNFYGVMKVTESETPPVRTIYSGTTRHGVQSLISNWRTQPMSYFHPEGPLGQLFREIAGGPLTARVGIVGLGAGSIACYGRKGEDWTFYEINPADVVIARDSGMFSFLKDCKPKLGVVLGDGRLSLAREPDGSFGLIILDAFSSDSVPIHLITRQAVEMYLSKLAPGGILVFNISNRHLDLRPVLGNIAADIGLEARVFVDPFGFKGTTMINPGLKDPSTWTLLARNAADFDPIARDARWKPSPTSTRVGVWTDDYANLLSVFGRTDE